MVPFKWYPATKKLVLVVELPLGSENLARLIALGDDVEDPKVAAFKDFSRQVLTVPGVILSSGISIMGRAISLNVARGAVPGDNACVRDWVEKEVAAFLATLGGLTQQTENGGAVRH
jgi:hypothetical protein